MARKRMIDPNMWQSEDSSKMSTFARFVFVGMFSIADDSGRGRANATYIKSTLFPYDDMPTADVDAALSEIAQHMSITFYKTANGNEYYSLNNWNKWQKIDRPIDSLFPVCDDSCEIIRVSTVVKSLVEDSTRTRRATTANRIEENRKEDKINKDIYSDVVSLFNQNTGTYYCIRSPVSDFSKGMLNQCSAAIPKYSHNTSSHFTFFEYKFFSAKYKYKLSETYDLYKITILPIVYPIIKIISVNVFTLILTKQNIKYKIKANKNINFNFNITL